MKKTPSSDPSLLREQLLAALQSQSQPGANGAEGTDPWRFRTSLRLIVGEAWRCASRSDFTTHRALLRTLIEAQELVRPHLPDPGPPEEEAAREVHYAAWALHVAEAFLRPAKTEARLHDRRSSASERKILRVLFENRHRYLRRKQIQEEMERLLPQPHPEATRISQILSDLWNEHLLTRMQGSAQGNPQTSFFALSRQGLELCTKLRIAEPQPLFEPDEAKWGFLLRREELASNPDRPEDKERIAAFYRPRPGVGCSLALTHCAVSLADNLPSDRRVLILNLEGEESSLPDHLSEEPPAALRGLAGLLEDYQAQPEEGRRSWLESSLFDARYACRVQGRENLFYLPAFQPRPDSDPSHVHTELLDSLRREIELQPRRSDGAPRLAAEGFLGDLRQALDKGCAKTLIQAPCGRGPGTYLACVLLAEELVLFLRPNDDQQEGIRKTLREVVGTCLWRREAEPEPGLAPIFVFSRLAVDSEFEPKSAIDRLLSVATGEREESRGGVDHYRIVRLHNDERLNQSAHLLDLWSDRSLLGKGLLSLIEMLHPDSSLTPVHYKREYEEMEQIVAAVVHDTRAGVSVSASSPSPPASSLGRGYSDPPVAAAPPPPGAEPSFLRRTSVPDRPSEPGLASSIKTAVKNAEAGEALRKRALIEELVPALGW